jgi:hypothetical protein
MKILQNLDFGRRKKVFEKSGKLGRGFGILLSQKNRGHREDCAREAG